MVKKPRTILVGGNQEQDKKIRSSPNFEEEEEDKEEKKENREEAENEKKAEIENNEKDEKMKSDFEDENEDENKPDLTSRRFSLGKIPVPPMTLTVEDIKNAAKQSASSNIIGDAQKPVDPRRSSVTLDVYKSFRESNAKKHLPNKDQIVYVETKGMFRAMKKGTFQIERMLEKEREEEIEKHRNYFVPSYLKDVGHAFHAQRGINQFAVIVQGFLAGIAVTLAVFSFNFGIDVLMLGYRWMSLPIHAIFLVAFSLGLITAIDRTGIYEAQHFYSFPHLKEMIINNGLFGMIIWSIGLISTLLCVHFDVNLSFQPTTPPSDESITIWRTNNVIRALTAAIGWLILAFKPDSDVVSKQLRSIVFKSVKTAEIQNTSPLIRNNETPTVAKNDLILKAMNME